MVHDMPSDLLISEQRVSLEDIAAAAKRNKKIRLSDSREWTERIERGRRVLERAAELGRRIYGVNTGVGRTSRRHLREANAALQVNLLRMHGCGLGPHFSEVEARAILVARLVTLAKGYSGVRPTLLQALARLINSGIVPAIPCLGSVGASGDLTPLSYVGAVLMGERQAYSGGRLMPAMQALREQGLEPFTFEVKEGLALMNGTSVMSAVGALLTERSLKLIDLGEAASALALEIVGGHPEAMHAGIHEVKGHPGQIESARSIRMRLEGSERFQSGAAPPAGREIQDRYSLRCAPQLLGAARDSLTWITRTLETEVNGVSDNPIVDPDTGEIHNGGNFYGGHVALAMDLLKVALGTVINLFDRQFAFVVGDDNPAYPETLLPDDWLPEDQRGLHHGLKALQITVSALTALAHQRTFPDAVLSRQTECDNQDVVSMGTNATWNARAVLEFAESALASWLIALSQAAAIRGEERLSPAGRRLVARIREVVPLVRRDRPLDEDIMRLTRELPLL